MAWVLVMALCVAASPSLTTSAWAEADPNATAMTAFKMGLHFMGQKNYRKAAEMFREAYAVSKRPDFLYNVARAEQRAFQLDLAEKNFKMFLGLEGASAEGVRRAKVHLTEIADARAHLARLAAKGGVTAKPVQAQPVVVKPAPTAPVVVAKPAPVAPAVVAPVAPTPAKSAAMASKPADSPAAVVKPKGSSISGSEAGSPTIAGQGAAQGTWHKPVGWTFTVLGVIAGGVGGWMLATAAGRQDDLDGKTDPRVAGDFIVHIDYQTYEKEQVAINNQLLGGSVAMGVGLAGIAAGVALLATAPSVEVVALPSADGLTLGFAGCF